MWEGSDQIKKWMIAEEFGLTVHSITDRITREQWTKASRRQLVHVPRAEPEPDTEFNRIRRRVGNPPKYHPDLPAKMVLFFQRQVFDHDEARKKEGFADHIVAARTFPTLERFCVENGFAYRTLWEWVTERDESGQLRKPELANAYEFAKTIQAAITIEGGMAGLWQPLFGKMAARNLAKWRSDNPEDEVDSDATYPNRELLRVRYETALQNAFKQRDEIRKRRGLK